MKLLTAIILLCAPDAARAAAHAVTVRILENGSAYARTFIAEEGRQTNFAGAVSAAGAPDRYMIANLLVSGSEEPAVQYQLELSGGRGGKEPLVQAQGELTLRRNETATVAGCGSWRMDVGLDASSGTRPSPWREAGGDNLRLTAEVKRGQAVEKLCRQVTRAGRQSNLVEGFNSGGRRLGFILNSLVLPAPAPGKNAFNVQYQVEHSPAPGSSVQLQGEKAAIPGRKVSISSGGFTVDLLIEIPKARRGPSNSHCQRVVKIK